MTLKDMVQSAECRNFLKLSGAGAGGMLWSDEASAQTIREEKARQAAAVHTMTIATTYILGASRSYPLVQS